MFKLIWKLFVAEVREIQRYGGDYLVRYKLRPRMFRRWFAAYVHKFLASDPDEALHDHPFPFLSIVLKGTFIEYLEGGRFKVRGPGSIYWQSAHTFHRIKLVDKPVWTLFIRGPRRRDWGFQTPDGWVHHDKYEENGKLENKDSTPAAS